MSRSFRSQSGMTIIEMLVVLVVVAIVASISLVTFASVFDRIRQRATMADMRIISKAIEAYTVDNNFLPGDGGGLAALRPVIVPYCSNVLPVEDHWGHAYVYSRTAAGSYSLISVGKDGIDGEDYARSADADYDRDLVMFDGIFVAAPE